MHVDYPYKGKYNFVGGKVEQSESPEDAAYRELYEETGITRSQIRLSHFMDITYYHQDFVLEMYAGILEDEVEMHEEKNPLLWLPRLFGLPGSMRTGRLSARSK